MKSAFAVGLALCTSAFAADTNNMPTNYTCTVRASTGQCYKIDPTVLRGPWQFPTTTNKTEQVSALKARRYEILEQIADVLRRTDIANRDPYVQFLLAEDQRIILAIEKIDSSLSSYKALMQIKYPVPIPTNEKPFRWISPRLPDAYRPIETPTPTTPLRPVAPHPDQ